VQGTNDSSVVSKASAAAQGYFRDPFIQHFLCKVARRAPLINSPSCVPLLQILSLGAGFDSLYFRLHAEGVLDGTAVFEVDFPDVAQRKAALVACNVTLRGISQYRMLGVDVRGESQVEEALGAAGLDWTAPTLILSEVVLTYMETQWYSREEIVTEQRSSYRPFPEAQFSSACPAAVPRSLSTETQVPGQGQYTNTLHKVYCQPYFLTHCSLKLYCTLWGFNVICYLNISQRWKEYGTTANRLGVGDMT
ncbi:hypothetical protein GOODEAATRI_024748, partial [Goodea atripinnis]